MKWEEIFHYRHMALQFHVMESGGSAFPAPLPSACVSSLPGMRDNAGRPQAAPPRHAPSWRVQGSLLPPGFLLTIRHATPIPSGCCQMEIPALKQFLKKIKYTGSGRNGVWGEDYGREILFSIINTTIFY